MPNLHPPLTAFPFALLTCVFCLELAGWFRRDSRWRGVIRCNLILCAAGALAAFFSGYQAADLVDPIGPAQAVLERHHAAGRMFTLAIWPCYGFHFIWEKAKHNEGMFRALYSVCLLVCQGLVIYTGYLGGALVFEHGLGVTTARMGTAMGDL